MRLKIDKTVTGLMVCVVLLLAIWLTRLIGIANYPPFVDETIHIHGGELARSAGLFQNGQLGRQGTLWLMMAFQAYKGSPVWISRTVTVLALLPGIAALMGVARLAVGYWGAWFFALLFLFSNYHMFFARLALADPLAASAVMIAIYFCARLVRRRYWFDAFAAGVFLSVGFIAKVNIIPFFGIPIAAAICLHPHDRVNVRRQAEWLGVALGTAGILSALFVFGMRLAGQDVLTRSLFLALSGEGANAKNSLIDLPRLLRNVGWTYTLISSYLGWSVVVALIIAILILILRRQFFIALCLFGPMLATWISVTQESRFLVLPVALLLLAGAIVLGGINGKNKALVQVMGVGLILVWGAVQWLPFTVTTLTDIKNIPLSDTDLLQYVRSNAGGFGFSEAIEFLKTQPVSTVIGLSLDCQAFRYLAIAQHQPYVVDCPVVITTKAGIPDLETLLETKKGKDDVFVLYEKSDFVPPSIQGRLLATIERPYHGVKIYIYQLSPL